MPMKLHGAGLWEQVPLEEVGPLQYVTLIESDSLIRNRHPNSLLEVIV